MAFKGRIEASFPQQVGQVYHYRKMNLTFPLTCFLTDVRMLEDDTSAAVGLVDERTLAFKCLYLESPRLYLGDKTAILSAPNKILPGTLCFQRSSH